MAAPNPASPTGSRDPVQRGALLALAACLAVGALGAGAVLLAGRSDLVLSVLLGAGVAATVPAVTLGVLRVTAGRSAQAMAGVVMASYLVKLVVVGGLMFGFAALPGVERQALGVAALVGLVAALTLEVVGIVRTRQAYVEVTPRSAP